jgi:hypothetical protein
MLSGGGLASLLLGIAPTEPVGSVKAANTAPTVAQAITGYNASTDTFTLYNPWGTDQPGQLTWSQLQATCTQMAVANASNSAAISGVAIATSPSAAKGMSPAIVGAILASNDGANAQRTHALSPAAGGLAASLVDAALT